MKILIICSVMMAPLTNDVAMAVPIIRDGGGNKHDDVQISNRNILVDKQRRGRELDFCARKEKEERHGPVVFHLVQCRNAELGVCGSTMIAYEMTRTVQRTLQFWSSRAWKEVMNLRARDLLYVAQRSDVRIPTIPRRLEDEVVAAEYTTEFLAREKTPNRIAPLLGDPGAMVVSKLKRKAHSFFKAMIPVSVVKPLTIAQLTELNSWNVGHGFDFDAPGRLNDRSVQTVRQEFLSMVAGE